MILKILGLRKKNSKPSNKLPESDAISDLEHFVDYVVRALVDQPEMVSVNAVYDEKVTIQITCAKDDIGKIIGKNGKTISAIRALVNGAGKRYEKDVTVEVMD